MRRNQPQLLECNEHLGKDTDQKEKQGCSHMSNCRLDSSPLYTFPFGCVAFSSVVFRYVAAIRGAICGVYTHACDGGCL